MACTKVNNWLDETHLFSVLYEETKTIQCLIALCCAFANPASFSSLTLVTGIPLLCACQKLQPRQCWWPPANGLVDRLLVVHKALHRM